MAPGQRQAGANAPRLGITLGIENNGFWCVENSLFVCQNPFQRCQRPWGSWCVDLDFLEGVGMSESLSGRPGALDARPPMDLILRPRSIAIVGASADPRSFGGFVQGNLERFGYDGQLHLISRSSERIGGRPCLRTIDELPQGVDLEVLAIPEAGVLDAVRGLAARSCIRCRRGMRLIRSRVSAIRMAWSARSWASTCI